MTSEDNIPGYLDWEERYLKDQEDNKKKLRDLKKKLKLEENES